jgi:hypothetical protein
MPLADLILADPTLVSALAALLGAVLWLVRGLGPRQAVVLDAGRRALWRLLHPLASRLGRPLLRDKTDRRDEFIASVDADRRALLRVLWRHGFRWNVTSTVKYRRVDGDRQFALSVVHRKRFDADWQQDVHIFRNADNGWDVYGHWEPSVTDPTDHVGGGQQVAGDPEGVVRGALATVGE